jgi:pimeloyl-ACP methyl ester carboxylesterase
MTHLEAHDRAGTFVPHAFEEHIVDLGEIRMNYATAGEPSKPALLLIPSQSESWWGYERAMPMLAEHFQVFAVDLRGQGRSTWTPGRYTVDVMGGDLVRFIDLVIARPVIVSGLSSGGVLAAWLSAYAKPGQIRAAAYEDPPLFASEAITSCGQPVGQGMGPSFKLWNKYLGDQWTIGDWAGWRAAIPREISRPLREAIAVMIPPVKGEAPPAPGQPPQNLKEYDPEWGRAFASGTATASCDHATMLSHVKVPVLFTHHWHQRDEETGIDQGAISDLQASRVRELVTEAGQDFTYLSFPDMPHAMHRHQPELFSQTLTEWSGKLPG